MKQIFNRFFVNIAPFIGLGIFLVLLIAGIILFSYLLIFGAAVGLVLFVIAWIYNTLTGRKRRKFPTAPHGRTIDQEKE